MSDKTPEFQTALQDSSLVFQVLGRDLDPEEVSELLKLQPTSSQRRGDPRSGKSGSYAPAPIGIWRLEVAPDEQVSLDERISRTLAPLRERASALAELRGRGFTLEFFIGLFEIGDGQELVLNATQPQEVGSLSIDLRFDLYPTAEEDPPAEERT